MFKMPLVPPSGYFLCNFSHKMFYIASKQLLFFLLTLHSSPSCCIGNVIAESTQTHHVQLYQWHPWSSTMVAWLALLLRLFPLGGVSGPNSWFPECSVLGILRGVPQCLHVPSDAIHPFPSWSPPWSFSWHSHVNNCSHFVVFFHSLHVSLPA